MYGYLENFSSLFDENPSAMYEHDFAKFEEMVQKCAVAAVRDVRLAWTTGELAEQEIDINAQLINKIIAAYRGSRFGKNLSDAYINRVRKEFVYLIGTELLRSCHNQAHYDLILPIIFFRCIMLNEFNPESVERREAELQDDPALGMTEIELQELSAGYFDELQENKKWIKRRSPWIKTYSSGKVLTVPLYQLETKKKAFFDLISEAERKAVEAKFDTNEAIPLSVRVACTGFFPLKDQYETVKYCSEYARIGCFLYDLLEATANKEQPLDTILRLYMIAEVHDFLSCTGYVIRGEAYSPGLNCKERPLSRFNKVTGRRLMQFTSEGVPAQTETLLSENRFQKNWFLLFYDHLYANYTFNAPEILEFYLDKTILEPCIGMDETIKTYAKAVKAVVSSLPYLEHTVAHARTAIRMTNLFREDKLQESWENSEDYKCLQEAREILGL